MKRTLILVVLAVFFTGAVHSATVNIDKPIAGKHFLTGSKITITWSVSGSISGNFKILLRRANDPSFKVVIKENHPPAVQNVQYTIPHSTSKGSYFIRINYTDGFARTGNFFIDPGLVVAGSQIGPLSKPSLPTGLHTNTIVNAQLLTSVVINEFSVNGVSESGIHNRIKCIRSQGSICQVTAAGPSPRQFKYIVTLLNPSDGYRYEVYSSPWLNQNNHTIQISYDTVLNKLFPNGMVGMTIPVAVLGEITVQAKTPSQTEPPKQKEHAINFYL